MLASNPAWLYRGDPFASLEYKHAMRAVRARLDRGEPLFSDAVRQFLCENTCLASVEMVPDSGLQTRLESTASPAFRRVQARVVSYPRDVDARSIPPPKNAENGSPAAQG